MGAARTDGCNEPAANAPDVGREGQCKGLLIEASCRPDHGHAGDVAAARRAYQDFFAAWKDADADLSLMTNAKAEYAKLGPS